MRTDVQLCGSAVTYLSQKPEQTVGTFQDPARFVREMLSLALQTGALPWRLAKGDKPEVLLVTGRRLGRWMIPKGWPMAGKSLAEAAVCEAFEEAGISGTVDPHPLGSFHHAKRGFFRTTNVEILVHALSVDEELAIWPEQGERNRQWFPVKKALEAVDSAELRTLISTLGKQLKARGAE